MKPLTSVFHGNPPLAPLRVREPDLLLRLQQRGGDSGEAEQNRQLVSRLPSSLSRTKGRGANTPSLQRQLEAAPNTPGVGRESRHPDSASPSPSPMKKRRESWVSQIPVVHGSETLAVSCGPEVSLFLSPHVQEGESRGQKVTQCSLGFTGRNSIAGKQTSDQSRPERGNSTGFLLPLFCHSQEGELIPSPHFRSQCVKQTLTKIHVQVVDTQSTMSIDTSDWFVTIDLKDAYFHIAIYPAHRKFLRFTFQGKAYEYQAIPFGLSLAPRVFSKCVEAALSLLRSSGIRILSYIDDYLICSRSREQAVRDSATVINHLRDLRFNINWAKSRVEPAQCTEYLGLNINSLSYHVKLSEGRLISLTQCLSLFRLGKVISFRLCLRLLGLMASAISVVHLGHLMMRDVQRWVAALRLCPRRHLSHRLRITSAFVAALRPWRDTAAEYP